MTQVRETVLVIGYGNPGRLDDGLGPAFAEAIARKSIPGVTVESNYLLNVEDAAEVGEHDVVVFVDAAIRGPEPFSFGKVDPQTSISFTSHHAEPAAILGLAYDMFEAKTRGYVMGIRGYEFDQFGERLSDGAQNNLLDAIDFLVDRLERRDFSPLPNRQHRVEPSSAAD
jgi:hydrogenase maturation protease